MSLPHTVNILWKKQLDKSKSECVEVPSSFEITPEKQQLRDEKWKETIAKNPKAFDGPLWRYEDVNDIQSITRPLQIYLSPITYSWHAALRGQHYSEMQDYPNPASINANLLTTDDELIIAVKGGISDQRGLGAVGGFLKREVGRLPEDAFDATVREVKEEVRFKPYCPFEDTVRVVKKETIFGGSYNPIDIENMRLLGGIFAENKDTTFSMYVPLNVSSADVRLDPEEAAGTIYLPVKKLERFNENPVEYCRKELGGMPVGHLMGDMYLFEKALPYLSKPSANSYSDRRIF